MPRPWFSGSNINAIDLSNEILNIHFGEVAAKIHEVKVEGRNEIDDSARFETDAPTPGAEPVDVFSTSNFDR